MDALKKRIANVIYESIDTSKVAENAAGLDDPTATVEITRPDVLNTMIRVVGKHGPRYFNVRVSEMM
jgi:hypothetical protein